jgi:hypothetical protein
MPMLIRFFNILRSLKRHPFACLSFVLLILTVGGWVRSLYYNDAVRYRSSADLVIGCDCRRGQIVFEYFWDDTDPKAPKSAGFWHYHYALEPQPDDSNWNAARKFERLGFAYAAGTRLLSGFSSDGMMHMTSIVFGRMLAIPYWAICLPFGIPIVHAFIVGSHKTSPSSRACGQCGYDLRAHVPGNRCPECGTVAN